MSRQVREMERELQVPLLERDTRHLEMTAAGRSPYGDARRILALLRHHANAHPGVSVEISQSRPLDQAYRSSSRARPLPT